MTRVHQPSVLIDFQGGMHGNYLEFVCNRFIAGIDIQENLPFNKHGASHSKTYLENPKFICGHFSFLVQPLPADKVICVKIKASDLLPVQCVSLLRAGDYNIDPDHLEKNTYHKLNNQNYRWIINNLKKNFFHNQIVESYTMVKDPSWPSIAKDQDFTTLPQWIQTECFDQHHLLLYEFSDTSPDCPRHILREFFKIGFVQPSVNGFMVQQEKMQYHSNIDVYEFPFDCFYDIEKFQEQILKIADWTGYDPPCLSTSFVDIHEKFLSRQPFKNAKHYCDLLINQIVSGENFTLPKCNVIEEAYIESEIEKIFKVPLPIKIHHWFQDSSCIFQSLNLSPKNF